VFFDFGKNRVFFFGFTKQIEKLKKTRNPISNHENLLGKYDDFKRRKIEKSTQILQKKSW
jgi:hypothetical protein